MFLQIIILLNFIIIYQFIIKPWRLLNWYYKHLTNLGYKVYTNGYNVIGATTVDYQKDLKQHNDVNYTQKNLYYKYDIILDHFFDSIFMTIISPELFSHSFTLEKLYVSVKSPKLFAGAFNHLIGNSLVFNNNVAAWKRKRKMLTQIFNFDFLISMIPNFVSITKQNCQRLEKTAQFPIVDLQKVMIDIIGNISGKIFLGIDHGQIFVDKKPFSEFLVNYISYINDVVLKPQIAIFGPKIISLGLRKKHRQILQMKRDVEKTIKQIIKKHHEEHDRNAQSLKQLDLINLFFKNNQKVGSTNPQQVASDDQIMVEIITLVFASIDTSSHTLQNLIYYISKNPQVRKKVLQQIQTHIKKEQDILNYDILRKMQYFDCVFKQTLRHYGVLNGVFPRQAIVDHTLNDIKIKKGVILNYWTIPNYYNPQYFEQPQNFNPQRWLKKTQKQINPYIMMNFSAGPRSCIGKQLVTLQIKVISIILLKKYFFKLQKENYGFQTGLVFRPQSFKTQIIKI